MTEPRRTSAAARFPNYATFMFISLYGPPEYLWGEAESTQMNKRHLRFIPEGENTFISALIDLWGSPSHLRVRPHRRRLLRCHFLWWPPPLPPARELECGHELSCLDRVPRRHGPCRVHDPCYRLLPEQVAPNVGLSASESSPPPVPPPDSVSRPFRLPEDLVVSRLPRRTSSSPGLDFWSGHWPTSRTVVSRRPGSTSLEDRRLPETCLPPGVSRPSRRLPTSFPGLFVSRARLQVQPLAHL